MPNDDTADRSRQRDMILAPNEYAFISDETKGEVSAYVGPNKTSLAGTDRPVVFDNKTKRFRQVTLEAATQTFQTAPEGWYIVLKNPADKMPTSQGKLSTPELKVGKKVNLPGPASFALWPGQMAKVVQGHNLRSNEYLVVRVYDLAAARTNFAKAVVEPTDNGAGGSTGGNVPGTAAAKLAAAIAADTQSVMSERDLSMGKLFVIKGTDVSFYIPPTGIEVVPEKVNGEDRYVREAVSLERLEYCLLLDEEGTKRYVHGPAVVFPAPTEKFVEAAIKSNPDKVKAKKFRAQELTPASGIHIRVIADYKDDVDGVEVPYTAGEELFITGKEQTIYFPREEHAIIKYGEQEIHYGIAIPAGEARYVLNRNSGVIDLVTGPQIFLPDPRNQVIVDRALPLSLVGLMYPGNEEALAINSARLGNTNQDIMSSGGAELAFNGVDESVGNAAYSAAAVTPDTTRRVMIRGASKALPGDNFNRKGKFTPPRSIVLNTKFDGAVSVDIWTGYAMMLVSKSGDRRVVRGPQTVLLEYDEVPQVLTLSRGKPKTMDNPLHTVFLLTTANKVSDVVDVETKDLVKMSLKLSYRVNFEGETEKWFSVDNYVKFLCDNLRSRLRAAVQKLGVEEFYSDASTILRDTILGSSLGDNKPRTGLLFSENGMRIYDVEVLGVEMKNPEVEKLLQGTQKSVIQNNLTLAEERRKLAYTTEMEELRRQTDAAKAETFKLQQEIAKTNLEQSASVELKRIETSATVAEKQREEDTLSLTAENELAEKRLEAQQAVRDAAYAEEQRKLTLRKDLIKAEVDALVEKAKAISPDLVAALQSFGERAMVEQVAKSMAPLSIIGGDSVLDILSKMLAGTKLAEQLAPLAAKAVATKSNGASA